MKNWKKTTHRSKQFSNIYFKKGCCDNAKCFWQQRTFTYFCNEKKTRSLKNHKKHKFSCKTISIFFSWQPKEKPCSNTFCGSVQFCWSVLYTRMFGFLSQAKIKKKPSKIYKTNWIVKHDNRKIKYTGHIGHTMDANRQAAAFPINSHSNRNE